MGAVKKYFDDFLTNIRPSANQRAEMRDGQILLRKRLSAFEDLKGTYINTFLQGSYRRFTVVKPIGDKRSDVDIVVVTKFSEAEFTARTAQKRFEPFLEKHYKGKWKQQGRSFGISMSKVDFDLVITSAPSEATEGILKSAAVTDLGDVINSGIYPWSLRKSWQHLDQLNESIRKELATEPEWKTEPLRIPDHDANKWDVTDPLKQMRWTTNKNSRSDGHFVNVVKCLKWWRRTNEELPKRPKGYHIERIVAEACPDDIATVAQGVVETFEGIERLFADDRQKLATPCLPDIGIEENNVMDSIDGKDFAEFYDAAKEAAGLARKAYDAEDVRVSVLLWKELFGSEFPDPRKGSGGKVNSGFSERTEKSKIGGTDRFG